MAYWLMKSEPDELSINGLEKLGTAPLPKLARPCALGPMMRMPAARARATIDD